MYGFTGYLPFGYVGFFGAGAYGFALAVMHLHCAAARGDGCAARSPPSCWRLILTPLLRLSGAYFAIASLAAAQAVYEIVANPALEDITKGPYGVSLSGVFAPAFSYQVARRRSWPFDAAASWSGCAIRASAWRCRRSARTRSARRWPACQWCAGATIAWLLSALIAGLVGGVFAWHISVFYPDTAFDIQFSIFAIVFVLFGGATTLVGPILGVVILYGIYNAIGITVPQYFQLIYGALIVALVLFLPNGLVSLLTERGIRVP